MQVDVETEVLGTYRQIIKVDAHTLHADMPVASGGGNTAPGAHEYFDMSLATCKALTATWYAKKNGMALERVEAHVVRDATHEREGKYKLSVRLAFHGALSDDEKHRIYAAVAKCPVHKLMTTTEIEIETAPL